MLLPQPARDEIRLTAVLAALGDDLRLAIARSLGRYGTPEGLTCGQFSRLTSKTNLTHHVARLREAGVVSVRAEGTRRHLTLRRADLDALFPGLLDGIEAAGGAPLPDEFVPDGVGTEAGPPP